MELVLIKPQSPEWDWMWNWLSQHPINENITEPSVATNENESWQYMGTFKQANKYVHCLRHRKHPLTQNVVELNVNASPILTEEQIVRKYRM